MNTRDITREGQRPDGSAREEKSLIVRLDKSLWLRVKHQAVDSEMSVAQILRDALQEYLQHHTR